jgi:protein tyrosine phosphatase
MPRKSKPKRSTTPKGSAQRCGSRGAHQVVEGLFISGEAFATNKHQLHARGISSIVACGCQAHFLNSFDYKLIRVQDSQTANIKVHLEPAADFIAKSLRNGGSVLVHCKAGICRSATIIIAYLLKYKPEIAGSVKDALIIVRGARSCANPRREFVQALEEFQQELMWRRARITEPSFEAREEERPIEEAFVDFLTLEI